MKYIWIIFIIVGIEEIFYNKIFKNKKELTIYSLILSLSIFMCIMYYSDNQSKSILGMISDKVNLEKYVWIK